MANYRRKTKWKSILVGILVVATLIGACAGIAAIAKKDTKTISSLAFEQGGLTSDGVFDPKIKNAIFTKEMFECMGLVIETDVKFTDSFEVFFYNYDGVFLSKTDSYIKTTRLDVPELAKYARVMITTERKYFIVSIYRPFDKELGDTTTNDLTIGVEKAYPVETVWTANTAQDGTVTYKADYSEDTITFTSQLFDYVYYDQSTLFDVMNVKSHYLAFSTNKPIDSILEATITYSYDYTYEDVDLSIDIHKSETVTAKLTHEQVFEINNTNWFQEDYEYKRIQSVDAFLKCEEIEFTEETLNALKNEKWVFRFLETSYLYRAYPWRVMDTDVTAVSALQLKYEYRDKIYNVGVIADTVTDDDIAGGYVEQQEWWQKIVALLLVIIVLILWPFISQILAFLFGLILDGIKWLISFAISSLLWVITLPFRIIGWFLK